MQITIQAYNLTRAFEKDRTDSSSLSRVIKEMDAIPPSEARADPLFESIRAHVKMADSQFDEASRMVHRYENTEHPNADTVYYVGAKKGPKKTAVPAQSAEDDKHYLHLIAVASAQMEQARMLAGEWDNHHLESTRPGAVLQAIAHENQAIGQLIEALDDPAIDVMKAEYRKAHEFPTPPETNTDKLKKKPANLQPAIDALKAALPGHSEADYTQAASAVLKLAGAGKVRRGASS